LTEDINREGTLRVARAAHDAGVRRFVFASSCSMYGASGTDDALDEQAPLRPLTPYAESKVRAEEGLFALASGDFVPVSMRNATVFGASPRLRLDIVLNNLAAWAHTTGRIRLLSDGTAWRPLVHVRDVAKTALALLDAPEDLVRGEAFNVGTDEQNYLVRDLAEVLATVTGCEIELAEGSSADDRSYRVDFSKLARTFPGLELEWDAERGAHELADAYRAVGLTAEDFEGNRYVRLRRLSVLLERGELDDALRWNTSVAA
jgi:nucleoside-diphosphate-sugar epimerase